MLWWAKEHQYFTADDGKKRLITDESQFEDHGINRNVLDSQKTLCFTGVWVHTLELNYLFFL